MKPSQLKFAASLAALALAALAAGSAAAAAEDANKKEEPIGWMRMGSGPLKPIFAEKEQARPALTAATEAKALTMPEKRKASWIKMGTRELDLAMPEATQAYVPNDRLTASAPKAVSYSPPRLSASATMRVGSGPLRSIPEQPAVAPIELPDTALAAVPFDVNQPKDAVEQQFAGTVSHARFSSEKKTLKTQFENCMADMGVNTIAGAREGVAPEISEKCAKHCGAQLKALEAAQAPAAGLRSTTRQSYYLGAESQLAAFAALHDEARHCGADKAPAGK